MKRYRLYGLDLASSLPLSFQVPEAAPPAGAPPDLTFDLLAPHASLGAGGAGEVVYRSSERLPDGESALTASRAGGRILLRYAGEASFVLEERRILGRPERPGDDGLALVELRLLGPVLACWLERAGLLALHAAAATVAGKAVALLAANHGGKSCLAATLAAAGRPLLTDDVLAVEPRSPAGFMARPSYPEMRLWPEDAERFTAGTGLTAATLPRAHPGFEKLRLPLGAGGLGRFDPVPRPLGAVYVPERHAAGSEVWIESLPARQALLTLLRASFLPRLTAALGWSARRLDALARLAEAVPVRRLVYPDGHEHLREAADALWRDAAALS